MGSPNTRMPLAEKQPMTGKRPQRNKANVAETLLADKYSGYLRGLPLWHWSNATPTLRYRVLIHEARSHLRCSGSALGFPVDRGAAVLLRSGQASQEFTDRLRGREFPSKARDTAWLPFISRLRKVLGKLFSCRGRFRMAVPCGTMLIVLVAEIDLFALVGVLGRGKPFAASALRRSKDALDVVRYEFARGFF
jgi:hypothetical protein